MCDESQNYDEVQLQQQMWHKMFLYAIELAADSFDYIAKSFEAELLNTVDKDLVEQIIFRAIYLRRQDPSHDTEALISMMLKLKKCDSVFKLLEQEKQAVLESQLKSRQNHRQQPLLTWSVTNLTDVFYKQSGIFQVEQAQWRLAVSHFKDEDPGLKIEIKLINNPFDIPQSKNYFKKKDFEVPSHMQGHKLDPVAQFEVECEQ